VEGKEGWGGGKSVRAGGICPLGAFAGAPQQGD
jgi:hypothetical protein